MAHPRRARHSYPRTGCDGSPSFPSRQAFVCLLAVLAGAETFVDIARFGEKKIALLRRFRPFRHGTPAHVELFAAEQKAVSFKDAKVTRQQTVDGDHGRIETRTTTAIHDVGWLQQRHQWPGLQGVVMVESTREIANRIERETRFYITSLAWLADQLGPVIRSHWAIGVSSEGHAVMSVKVRPEPKNSGSEAREALWRESKTAEPSDNILERSMREASGCNVQ